MKSCIPLLLIALLIQSAPAGAEKSVAQKSSELNSLFPAGISYPWIHDPSRKHFQKYTIPQKGPFHFPSVIVDPARQNGVPAAESESGVTGEVEKAKSTLSPEQQDYETRRRTYGVDYPLERLPFGEQDPSISPRRGGKLPSTNLDSFVHKSRSQRTSEFIYGDEGQCTTPLQTEQADLEKLLREKKEK